MLGLTVVGAASVLAYNQFTGVQSAAINQQAYDEVAAWITAAYGASIANGFNNTATNVADADALIAETSLTTATNAWAQTITVAAVATNINITYPFGGQDADSAQANCSFVRARLLQADGTTPSFSALTAAPAACTATNPSNLIVIID